MKRYLRVIMPILLALTIVFILSNSFSDATRATAKRDYVVKIVAGNKTFSPNTLAGIAKMFHMLEYAFFSFCLTSSVILFGDRLQAKFERVLLCGLVLALTDELVQSMFSERGSRVTDVVVDAAGLMVGYGATLLIAYWIKKRKEKTEKKKGT